MKWKDVKLNTEWENVSSYLIKNDDLLNNALKRSSFGVDGFIKMIIQNGGGILQKNQAIEGVALYTFGEPVNDFIDKSTLYIPLILIEPKSFRSFARALFKILKYGEDKNCHTLKFKARIDNYRNIKMYEKFSFFDKKEDSLVGDPSYTFKSSINFSVT